jgi:hypothetical protein
MTDKIDPARIQCIRDLNDAFRTTLRGGRVVVTRGIMNGGLSFHREVISSVRGFGQFSEANDPNDEHDFGALEVRGKKTFFKINYYDRAVDYGSTDPASSTVTTRVLTIMLAEEY